MYKEKIDKGSVPFLTTYHPVLKNLNSILRNNLPIFTLTKEWLTSSRINQWLRLNAQ